MLGAADKGRDHAASSTFWRSFRQCTWCFTHLSMKEVERPIVGHERVVDNVGSSPVGVRLGLVSPAVEEIGPHGVQLDAFRWRETIRGGRTEDGRGPWLMHWHPQGVWDWTFRDVNIGQDLYIALSFAFISRSRIGP